MESIRSNLGVLGGWRGPDLFLWNRSPMKAMDIDKNPRIPKKLINVIHWMSWKYNFGTWSWSWGLDPYLDHYCHCEEEGEGVSPWSAPGSQRRDSETGCSIIIPDVDSRDTEIPEKSLLRFFCSFTIVTSLAFLIIDGVTGERSQFL